MAAKNTLKQHIVAMIFFMIMVVFLSLTIFSKNLKKHIIVNEDALKDAREINSDLKKSISKDILDNALTEKEIKRLQTAIADLKKKSKKTTISNDINDISKTAQIMQKLNNLPIRIINSSIQNNTNSSILSLELLSSFPHLMEFINISRESLGETIIRDLRIKKEDAYIRSKLDLVL